MIDFIKTWGTLIVAVIALIQPWILAFYRRFFSLHLVDIYETGNMEIGFSKFGPTLGLHGTLRAVNRDLFIRSMDLKLIRLKDRAEHNYSWGLFRSERLSTTSGQDTTLQICSGFMLTQDSPFSYNIQFWDRDVQEELRTHLEALRTAWTQAFIEAGGQPLLEPGADLAAVAGEVQTATQNLFKTFSHSSHCVQAYNGIQRLCYWEPGRYLLEISVNTSRPDGAHSRSWEFVLSQAEVEALRLNSVKILEEACGQLFGVYNFAYPKYLKSAPSASIATPD
jgi:hypothetical protein